MTEQHYDIFFTGKLVEGVDQNKAIENAAKLFKLAIEEASKLFSGKPQLLKRRVNKAEALKYKAALHQAGLLTVFKLSTTPDKPPTNTNISKPTVAQKTEASLTLAPAGSDVLKENERRVYPTVNIDTSAIKLRSPFLDPEINRAPPPPAPPSTSHLKIAELGATLQTHTDNLVLTPTINTHNLSLAPTGSLIETLKTQTTTLNPDIHSLSLTPLGSESLPPSKLTVTPPDVSHLSLAKEE